MSVGWSAKHLASLILTWFSAGAWVGVIDAVVALHASSGTAGGWIDRIGTLGVSALVWGTTCVLLLLLVSAPAALLSRRSGCSRRDWSIGLATGAITFIAGLIFLESRNLPITSATFVAGAAACGLGALLVAGFTAIAVKRFSPRGSADDSHSRRWPWALTAAAIACLLASSLGWPEPVEADASMPPNVLFISVDTLRADHLGVYGYERATSPNLDTLAREGVYFERAYAPSQWCLPSHASMMTGLDALAHGVRGPRDSLHDRHTTLAETLRSNGYRTAAFIAGSAHGFVGAERGFDRGFDKYHHFPHYGRWRTAFLSGALDHAYNKFVRRGLGGAELQLDRVLRWVSGHQDRPFFLFVHLLDVHAQNHRLRNEAPEPFRDMFCPDYAGDYDGCTASGRCAGRIDKPIRLGLEPPPTASELERIICLYDGSIAYADSELGRFFSGLDDLGLYDRTVIAVTADHGEEFMEHGVLGHAQLYNATLHVPLILRAPNLPAGRAVKERARVIDVPSTLIELVGLESGEPRPGKGRSLVALARGEEEPGDAPPDIAISPYGSVSVRTDRFHFLRHDFPPEWVTVTDTDKLSRDGGELIVMRPDEEIPSEIRAILRDRGAEDLVSNLGP
jgi:arylsulfatase A-like enzyme